MKSTSEIKNKLIGAFIFTSFVVSILYGLLVFNAMKYTEDDILTRRLELEAEYYFQNLERSPSNALLPASIGLHSYLSSSINLPSWLRQQKLGTRELHKEELHIGVFEIPNSNQRLYITLSELDVSNLESEIPVLILILVSAGALIVFIGLVIGLIFSNYISKPIISLTEDVNNHSAEDNSIFYGAERSDEVGKLSRSFNALVVRLHAFLIREKKFTQYVSHELRTPISIVSNSVAVLQLPGQTEDKLKKNLARIRSATNEMESLVNTFLSLGRESSSINTEIINVVELLKSNIKRNKLVASNKKLNIQLNIKNDINININKNFLNILIDNIIRNIFIHSETKAIITLAEKSIVFENDIQKESFEINEVRDSYGMEIISQLAEKANIQVTSQFIDSGYILKLSFDQTQIQ